jgi:hypothetical protein
VKQINAERMEQEINQLIRDIVLPPSSWDALEEMITGIAKEEEASP